MAAGFGAVSGAVFRAVAAVPRPGISGIGIKPAIWQDSREGWNPYFKN
jgi:hypothetical protein